MNKFVADLPKSDGPVEVVHNLGTKDVLLTIWDWSIPARPTEMWITDDTGVEFQENKLIFHNGVLYDNLRIVVLG